MKVSFKPLTEREALLLSMETGINFTTTDFKDEQRWLCCTVRDGTEPAVIIVFEFKTWFDAHLSLAVFRPKGLSRRLISALYQSVFSRAKRVSALIDPQNDKALRQVSRMGFRYEGYQRLAVEGERDAVLFGMTEEDCFYMRGVPFRFRTAIVHEAPEARM